MASDIHDAAGPGPPETSTMTALVKGIVDDALALIRQQFTMLKAELRADAKRLVGAVVPLVMSIAPLLLGVVMLCFCLVHLLHWATTPAANADPASIPLWGCYAIVSALFLVIGGALAGLGAYRLKSFNPLPDESAKALEENVKWLMNPK
jgi:hypothetical protein